jgi:hypothetical protein
MRKEGGRRAELLAKELRTEKRRTVRKAKRREKVRVRRSMEEKQAEWGVWEAWRKMKRKPRVGDVDVEGAAMHYTAAPPRRDSFDEGWRMYVEEYVAKRLEKVTERIQSFSMKEALWALKKSRGKLMSAEGDDGIRNIFLIEELLEALLVLVNYLVSSNERPEDWAQHRVQYIPKTTETCDYKQMRPVSLASVLSKWFERLMQPRLERLVSDKLYIGQAAFRKGRSIIDPLVCVTDAMRKCLGRCSVRHPRQKAFVFLDIEKAYDSVWITGLLFKLLRIRVPVEYVVYLRIWLEVRWIYVMDGGRRSKKYAVRIGLPQGGVLCCLLWDVYINDLAEDVQAGTLVEMGMLADDVEMSGVEGGAAGHVKLQRALERAETWADKWRVVWSVVVNRYGCW